MLASLKEFKFFQQFRIPIEEVDEIRFLVEKEDEAGNRSYIDNARLVDISVTGLGFSTTERLGVDSEIYISLQFKRFHLDLEGVVVRSFSHSITEDSLIYGVSLEEDKDFKRFLEQFIYSFPPDRLRECLVQSALSERYTTAHEGFEMFSLLLSLFSDMSKFGDKKEFLDNMLEEVCRILNASRATLLLVNTETNELEAVSALGMDNKLLKFDYRLGIAGQVFTTGVSLNIDTEKDKSRFDSFFDSITGFKTKSIICHPIHNREDKVIGVIEVLNKRNEDRFSIDDEIVMKVVSLVFSSLYHNYNPISETSMIRRFSTPFDREYALVGNSEFTNKLRSVIIKFKDVDSPLLIEGETGTGKTLLSKIFHYEGKRGLGTFDIINCSGASPDFLREELLGSGPKASKLETCRGGTLVIKNIDTLSLEMQNELYNILCTGKVPDTNSEIDLKFIFTTQSHLPMEVEAGRFKPELYEVLSQSYIALQPLRKRKKDLDDLIQYFIKVECKRQGFLVKNLAPSLEQQLKEYDWPGNISELRKSIERLVLYHPKSHIISAVDEVVTPMLDKKKMHMPLYDVPHADNSELSLKDRVTLIEREILLSEIKKNQGNKSKAALAMGISREALRKKLLLSDEVLKRITEAEESHQDQDDFDSGLKKVA